MFPKNMYIRTLDRDIFRNEFNVEEKENI